MGPPGRVMVLDVTLMNTLSNIIVFYKLFIKYLYTAYKCRRSIGELFLYNTLLTFEEKI